MFYIIGDIHGYYSKLRSLIGKIETTINEEDTVILLGDYIDRGPQSFEVIDFLQEYRFSRNVVPLMGNHEDMFLKYLSGNDKDKNYLVNGGGTTIESYKKKMGNLSLPRAHRDFFESLQLYYEGDDFIAVHAGLNPKVTNLKDQKRHDMLWIRDDFHNWPGPWNKTIIFGHTPTRFLGKPGVMVHDRGRNIIGLDCGVIMGYPLCAVQWPTLEVLTSE